MQMVCMGGYVNVCVEDGIKIFLGYAGITVISLHHSDLSGTILNFNNHLEVSMTKLHTNYLQT